jgi:hypothetical protein
VGLFGFSLESTAACALHEEPVSLDWQGRRLAEMLENRLQKCAKLFRLKAAALQI